LFQLGVDPSLAIALETVLLTVPTLIPRISATSASDMSS
jgi:hypothetical protein